ncbi:MAG TPA: SH3 domain-containing protein [Acidimicrobiales bacterium]|nr:SH3 domain-containing protein [Acidimicrobiales bacterium]
MSADRGPAIPSPPGLRPRHLLAATVTAVGVLSGCTTGGRSSAPTTSSAAPSTSTPVASSTIPGTQTSGPRTVISPIGLNVRRAPSRTAPVLSTAAQGVVLTVLGYTSAGGGWFNVKGQTVTGWISAQPTLSARGEFHSFSAPQFSALYPAEWSESSLPGSASPPGVVFRPSSGSGDIVATWADTVAHLPEGRTGYGRVSVTTVIACGTTAGLVVFQQSGGSTATTGPGASGPESLAYLAEVRFAVDKQHALGFEADMPDLGQTLDVFKEFLASVSYPAPQCSGG